MPNFVTDLIRMRHCRKFLKYIQRLEPVEFWGIKRILGVKSVAIDSTLVERSAEDIILDCIQAFVDLRFKQRRNLLKLLKCATSQKQQHKNEEVRANGPESSK